MVMEKADYLIMNDADNGKAMNEIEENFEKI